MTHFQAFFPTTKHLWLYCIILSYDWLSSTINIHFWPMSALYCGSLVTGHLFDMCKRARLHCWQTHQTLCWSTECITMCYNAHTTLDCQTAKKNLCQTFARHTLASPSLSKLMPIWKNNDVLVGWAAEQERQDGSSLWTQTQAWEKMHSNIPSSRHFTWPLTFCSLRAVSTPLWCHVRNRQTT